MVNPHRGEHALPVAGSVYTLRLTVEACIALEADLGVPLEMIRTQVNAGRIRALRALLWAALQDRHGDSVPTVDAVGTLIDQAGGVAALRPILRAFLARNADQAAPRRSAAESSSASATPWASLYLAVRSVGVSGEAFWRLSLRELWLEVAAARQLADRDTRMAYAIAVRAAQGLFGKLPPLASLLSQAAQQQTPEEQRLILQGLSAQLGIPLERVTLH